MATSGQEVITGRNGEEMGPQRRKSQEVDGSRRTEEVENSEMKNVKSFC